MKLEGHEETSGGAPRGASAHINGALDAIRRTMAYVAVSADNREAFARAPGEVLCKAAAGLRPEDIARARRALEDVLRTARFDWGANAQALLGIAASVVRANARPAGPDQL